LALERGLDAIAITDHDTVEGITEAMAAAVGRGLEVIPGVEISAESGTSTSLHILGFYIDPQDSLLTSKLKVMRDARLGRASRMVDLLYELGIEVTWDKVAALAVGESVGRPHVARALLDRGYVTTIQEAFDRFIGPGCPAYVSRQRMSSEETIQAIVTAGGVPVLAHPAHSGSAIVDRIPEFVTYGLCGLEVYYPHHSRADVDMLLALCQEYELIATGGTDFHAPDNAEGAQLGSIYVPSVCVEQLRNKVSGVKM
jgi:predicted metal-dependent phosphoesterase TrpH